MWGFFQRLFYGRSGQPPTQPVNANRVITLINSRISRIMKNDRIEQIKTVERIVKPEQNRVLAADKQYRTAIIKDQRIIKVKS